MDFVSTTTGIGHFKPSRPGAQYDQFDPTKASLSGTLNISRPTSFVPNIGSTFKIMNFNSETGKFSKVNGLAINSTEHFTLTYQPSDVLLTVVSGAAPSLGQPNSLSSVGPSYSAMRPGQLGFGLYGRGILNDLLRLSPRVAPMAAFASPTAGEPLFDSEAQLAAWSATTRSRSWVDFAGSSRFGKPAVGLGTPATPSSQSISSLSWLRISPNAAMGLGTMSPAKLASMAFVGRASLPNRSAPGAFAPFRNLTPPILPQAYLRAGASRAIHNRINAVIPRNNGRVSRRTLQYNFDLLSLLGRGPRQALRPSEAAGLRGQCECRLPDVRWLQLR